MGKSLKVCLIEGVMPHIEVKLFHDEEKYLKALDKQKIVIYLTNADAETCPVTLKDGTVINFVLIRDAEKVEYEKQLALLCHESVHIAQDYFERIGEEKPAPEEQAYVTQAIFQCLAIEHRKWINERVEKS